MNSPCSTTPGMALSAAASASAIGDGAEVAVEDGVAAVGDEILRRPAACAARPGRGSRAPRRRLDMATRRGEAETIDLDRQLEFAEHRHFLAGVGDDHHALRRRRDDFFAQQRAAAALDQPQGGIEFVGAVHGQVEFRRLIERRQAQTPFFGLDARCAPRWERR